MGTFLDFSRFGFLFKGLEKRNFDNFQIFFFSRLQKKKLYYMLSKIYFSGTPFPFWRMSFHRYAPVFNGSFYSTYFNLKKKMFTVVTPKIVENLLGRRVDFHGKKGCSKCFQNWIEWALHFGIKIAESIITKVGWSFICVTAK